MSIEEKVEMHRIAYIAKLYIEESPNAFTIDKIEFGPLSCERREDGYWKFRYQEGYIILKDMHSPVKLTLHLKELYKWVTWRNTKLCRARYEYIQQTGIVSNSMADLELYDLKKIVRMAK